MKHLPKLAPLLALVIAGCPPQIIPLRSEGGIERSYRIEEPRSAALGEPLVVIRRLTSAPQYEVAFDYTPPQHDLLMGGLDYLPLRREMRFVQTATRGDGAIGIERTGYGVTRPGSLTNRETYLPVTIWISGSGVVDGSMEGKRWTAEQLFLPMKTTGAVEEAMRTEIILTAVDGSMIDATYREFEGGAPTPSLERPLRFDLTNDRRIDVAGLVIQVDELTGASIRYRIIREMLE